MSLRGSKVDWEKLFEKLYELHHDPYARLPYGSYYDPRFGAKMTEVEWEEFLGAVKGPPHIPITIGHTSWGFNISLDLWEPSRDVYPGATIPAKRIFSCAPCHHPSYDALNNRLLLYSTAGEPTSWDLFAPIVNAPENLQALEEAHLPRPKDKAFYAY